MAGFQARTSLSGPLNRTNPDPHLALVRWGSKPDPDSSSGPGNVLSGHQFLDAVVPDDPSAHLLRDGRALAITVVRGCCTSGMNEWQLQEVLRSRWLIDGVVLNGELLFLAGWEVMTNWERNDAHRRFDLPSADFVLLDRQGRLVVLELKMRIRSPGDCLRALCQVTNSAVRLAEAFTLGKLAWLSDDCRGDLSTGSKNDPVGVLRDAHTAFFSLSNPVPLVGTEVRRAVAAREFGPRWPSMVEFFTESRNGVLRAHLQSHYGVAARSNLAMRRYLELPSPLPRCSPEVATLLVRTE